MMQFTDATGLLGCALAMAAASVRVPGVSRLAHHHRRWLAGAVFVAALLPVGALPLAGYLRGATGDLSLTTLILLCASTLNSLHGRALPRGRNWLLLLVACAAAVFYPLALGWGGFDPYRLGFGSYGFLACLLAFVVLAMLRGLPLIALAVALAVLAWSTGWYESNNLWDYLLDPLASIYAAGALAAQGIRRALSLARV